MHAFDCGVQVSPDGMTVGGFGFDQRLTQLGKIEVQHRQVDQVAAEDAVVRVPVGVGQELAGGEVGQGEGADCAQDVGGTGGVKRDAGVAYRRKPGGARRTNPVRTGAIQLGVVEMGGKRDARHVFIMFPMLDKNNKLPTMGNRLMFVPGPPSTTLPTIPAPVRPAIHAARQPSHAPLSRISGRGLR